MRRIDSPEDVLAALAASPRARKPAVTPVTQAIALLSRREHSARELVRKLAARGVAQEEAATAVQRVAQAGWQSDGRFAEAMARTRLGAGYGPLHVRAELKGHAVSAQVIDTALSQAQEAIDWREVAVELVHRRYRTLRTGDLAARRKAWAFLARRGYGAQDIARICGAHPDEAT